MKTKHLTTFLLLFISSLGWSQTLSKQELIDSLTSIVESRKMPGMFISVIHKDSVILQKGFGLADVESQTPVSENHLFKIGSVSKTFTSLAIMKLVNEGKLSLEDKLHDIAPEVPFENRWEATHPVKVKHLLEHKAGFDDMHFTVIASARTADMTALDEVMAHRRSMKSQWKPGLGHSYSNPGYVILGHIIEKTAGVPYQEYIKQNILDPMGMVNTYYASQLETGKFNSPIATGYSWINDTINLAQENKLIGEAAGALLSNAKDMTQLLRLFLNKDESMNSVVDFNTIKEMELLHGDLENENKLKDGYSLGLYTRRYGDKDYRFTGHSGGIFGYSADFIYSKELDLGIAMSNNMESGHRKFIDLIVNNYAEQSSKKAQVISNEISTFKAWEGTYRMMTTRNAIFNFLSLPFETIKVKVEGDSLSITRFMQDKEMYAMAGGSSFQKSDAEYATAFLTELNGDHFVNYHSDVLKPVNGFLLFMLRLVLALSIVGLLFAAVVLIIRLFAVPFKKTIKVPFVRILIAALPYLFIVGFIAVFLSNASLHGIINLSKVSVPSVLILLFSSLYPIALVVSGVYLAKNWKSIPSKFWRVSYATLFAGAMTISIYCMSFQWVFLAFWKY